MTPNTVYYSLLLFVCLIASVLKFGVFWQPSRLPVYPTAMSWIVDKTDKKRDFWPSEEGFMEIKKRRLKRSKDPIEFINFPNTLQKKNFLFKKDILASSKKNFAVEYSGMHAFKSLFSEFDLRSKSVPDIHDKGSGKITNSVQQTDEIRKLQTSNIPFRDNKGSGRNLDFIDGSGISGFGKDNSRSTLSVLEFSGSGISAYGESGADIKSAHEESSAYITSAYEESGADITSTHEANYAGSISTHEESGADIADAHEESGAGADITSAYGESGVDITSAHEESGAGTTNAYDESGSDISVYEESGSGGLEILFTYKTLNKQNVQTTEMSKNEILGTKPAETNTVKNKVPITKTDIKDTNSAENTKSSDITTNLIFTTERSSIKSGKDVTNSYSEKVSVSTFKELEIVSTLPTKTTSDSDSRISIESVEISRKTLNNKSTKILNENFTPSMLDNHMKDRHCSSIIQCDGNRNERCIKNGITGTCQCGRTFIRNLQTRKCEAKLLFTGMLVCPNQPYNSDLDIPTSKTFRNAIRAAEDTLMLIVDNSEILSAEECQIKVVKFHHGSLIVEWQLMIPESKRNGSLETMAVDLEDDFNNAMQFVIDSPVDIGNATFLNVSSEENPCENAELNHCSPNAVCLLNSNKSSGFECHCKDDYLDVSPSPINYGGEICEAICPDGYCKNKGMCYVLQNRRVCKCQNLYIGQRCQISGLVLGSSCSGIIVIAFVILIISGKFHNRNKVIHYKDYELKESLGSKGSTEKIIQLKHHNHFYEEKTQFAGSSI